MSQHPFKKVFIEQEVFLINFILLQTNFSLKLTLKIIISLINFMTLFF